MRWLRSHLRFGSRLALFALALQFVLSFGHIHVEGFAPSPSSVLAQLAAAVDGPPSALPDDPSIPAKQKQPGHADDFCAICSLIHLANTLVPSVSPVLPLPAVISTVRLDLRASRELAASQRVSFRARAPPLA